MILNNPGLKRFLDAQEKTYPTALVELQTGIKRSHWIWYIFPQLKGLGRSNNADFFGLDGLSEAFDYIRHPILGQRLKACIQAVLIHKEKNIDEILGDLDALKFKSCLTLFSLAAPMEHIFGLALECFFNGELDARTIELLTLNIRSSVP